MEKASADVSSEPRSQSIESAEFLCKLGAGTILVVLQAIPYAEAVLPISPGLYFINRREKNVARTGAKKASMRASDLMMLVAATALGLAWMRWDEVSSIWIGISDSFPTQIPAINSAIRTILYSFHYVPILRLLSCVFFWLLVRNRRVLMRQRLLEPGFQSGLIVLIGTAVLLVNEAWIHISVQRAKALYAWRAWQTMAFAVGCAITLCWLLFPLWRLLFPSRGEAQGDRRWVNIGSRIVGVCWIGYAVAWLVVRATEMRL